MHHLQDPNVRNKIYSTNLQRYGSTNPGSNQDIESKRIQTNLQRYGVTNPMENPEIKMKSLRNRLQISRCIFPDNTKRRSIDSWNRRYRDRDEINLSEIEEISYCGSSFLVYPWEDKSRILNSLKLRKIIDVYNCTMLMIYKKVAHQFLRSYSISGTDRRIELCIGLVYEDSLVQLMTIGKARDLDHTYQIYHLCTKPEVKVKGGARKMFQYATQEFEVSNIIAYQDTSKPYVDKFSSFGMKTQGTIEPQKIWYHHNLMIPDDQIFERDLKKMFDDTEGSKHQILQEHDWKSFEINRYSILEYNS